MNAILGFSQLLLKDRALGPTQRQHLDTIVRSGQHLLAVINDILDMSKIEAGHAELSIAVFDLRDLVSDLAAIFRLRTNAKACCFGWRWPKMSPSWCGVTGTSCARFSPTCSATPSSSPNAAR